MIAFLRIRDIYDVAGYDHGWVLVELMKRVGDEKFNSALTTLNENETENVRQYFEVGMDGPVESMAELRRQFPLTFQRLGL